MSKKVFLITAFFSLIFTVGSVQSKPTAPAPAPAYKYPEFYRGIYLVYNSGKEIDKLKVFVDNAKKCNLNTMVIDVQPAKNNICPIPKENVDLLLKNNIHPVARVVCFNQGLKTFPVPQEKITSLLEIAESAAQNGFKEIQFDYIRFNDSSALKKMTLQEKYSFVENFLTQARSRLSKYNVRIAADIFGRIPLNNNDIIGQKMEVFDKVVDVICPMAYPSHYTWSEKMMKDPYFTVYETSKKAKERVTKAHIVSYIQAFQIKISYSGLTYEKYLEDQIRAVYDSQVKGYILWNARQDYDKPYAVLQKYYSSGNKL